MKQKDQKVATLEDETEQEHLSRRDILKSAGKAAYVAPTLTVLPLVPLRAAAQSTPPPPPGAEDGRSSRPG